METNRNSFIEWQAYCSSELSLLTPILSKRGYTLDAVQPHLAGERFLMQAVTTTHGRKLILFGTDSHGARVVIKATRDTAGTAEILHERTCRQFLTNIDFAAAVFHTPPEVYFTHSHGFTILIQAFIEQPSSFLERPFEEQFFFALNAFKAQEGAHAATYKHRAKIAHVYAIREARDYLRSHTEFSNFITHRESHNKSLRTLLSDTAHELARNTLLLDQYSSYLTHTDFVPHNFRIDTTDTMYLLDFSSLVFGNKYEGWARFLNFMTLYHEALESSLIAYIRDNRAKEELATLRLMRLYRLTELIRYYVGTLDKSDGNLHQLNTARIDFWSQVLAAELQHTRVSEKIRTNYQTIRDSLRSDEEKKRQEGLH